MRSPVSTLRALARALAVAAALAAPAAHARTVILTAAAADRMAGIAEAGPRLSWASVVHTEGAFDTRLIDLTMACSFLIRFDLAAIPRGQRISSAELVLPVNWYAGSEPRLFVWRAAAEWGPGVCHLYRLARPKPVPWVVAGARGSGSDRATMPTAAVPITRLGEVAVNVTEDVALWYSGGAPAYGWILSVEDVGVLVRLLSPSWDRAADWKLKITYEPE